MKVEQFFDAGLAHMSYAVISENEMAVIDPGRDPQPYFEFAKIHKAKITTVIETHPHADFVSSHKEIGDAGAKIYVSKLARVSYPHVAVDEGDIISIGKIKLKILHTPGHSPDSISVVLENEEGLKHSVFTGDTLFIGDVGRPDLREATGNTEVQKENLARQMYYSLRDKLMKLPDDTLIYPAHGPGSLCGKAMSTELFSTIGKQKKENYALQPMKEAQFVKVLLENQPFVPKYFPFDVELNREGALPFKESISTIVRIASESAIEPGIMIVDSRNEKEFKQGHIKGAINIPNGGKFETWLGSVISPEESFYLIASSDSALDEVIIKAAKIGYEIKIKGALAQKEFSGAKADFLQVDHFKSDISSYNIIDVRDEHEVKERKIFPSSISIPLQELRERIKEIPLDKPLLVHCAGGYRSAIGSSILNSALDVKVFDLSESIKNF